ncbi:hypothetical protein BH09BAC1_BH09BAC1_28110 [soil metagenome]
MKVFFFGESSNDSALAKLVAKRFPKADCISYSGTIQGSHVDNIVRAGKAIRAKIKTDSAIKVVVLIRDLDAARTNATAYKKRDEWYKALSKEFDRKSLFLLHIQMSEALLLGDIETINECYGVKINYTKNPEGEPNPKKVLKDATEKGRRKYSENDTTELYPLLDYQKLLKVPYFKTFDAELNALLNPPPAKKTRNL